MISCYVIEGNPRGQRRAVEHILITPLNLVPVLLVEGGGGSAPSIRSISLPASSVHRYLYPLRLALIARPSHWMWSWSLAGSRSADNILLKILHVSSNIHAFFLASRALGLGMALRRATKSLSSIVGIVGGRRGKCVRLPRYSVC